MAVILVEWIWCVVCCYKLEFLERGLCVEIACLCFDKLFMFWGYRSDLNGMCEMDAAFCGYGKNVFTHYEA